MTGGSASPPRIISNKIKGYEDNLQRVNKFPNEFIISLAALLGYKTVRGKQSKIIFNVFEHFHLDLQTQLSLSKFKIQFNLSNSGHEGWQNNESAFKCKKEMS